MAVEDEMNFNDYIQCPKCYAYFTATGAIPVSVFAEDSTPIDKGNIHFCVNCGCHLKSAKKDS